MIMIMIMMTSAVRVRKCERRGWLGGGTTRRDVVFPPRQWCSYSGAIHLWQPASLWKVEDVTARSEPAEFTPSASHSAFHFSGRQREAQLPTLSATTSVRHLAPLFFAPLSVGGAVAPNWFHRVGLAHTQPRSHMDGGVGGGTLKKAYGWINDAAPPQKKKRDGDWQRKPL